MEDHPFALSSYSTVDSLYEEEALKSGKLLNSQEKAEQQWSRDKDLIKFVHAAVAAGAIS